MTTFGVVAFGLLGPACAPEDPAVARQRLLTDVITQPLSEDAVALAEAMGRHGDPADAAFLLDMVRIGFSSAAADASLDALAEVTSVARTGRLNDDYLAYGAFVMISGLDPGPDYTAFKAAIYAQADPAFVPLLNAVADRTVLASLQWGGVPVGGIVELRDPDRISFSAATWAKPEEGVFGVTLDDQAVAYPERILGRHELVDDDIANTPVVVTYCTLCRAARAYDRRVDGRVLDFRTSGLLSASNKVMVDDQTGSLWQQLTGVAIGGPLTGRQLDSVTVTTTTMGEWQALHPDSAVVDRPEPFLLDPETGTLVTYNYEPDAAYAGYNNSAQLWYPVLDTPPDIAAKALVATVSDGRHHLAVSLTALVEHGALDVTLGGRRLRIQPAPRGATVTALEGDTSPPASLALGQSTSTWGLRPQTPSTPASLALGQSYWFAWFGAHPDTDWWPRAGAPGTPGGMSGSIAVSAG